MEILWEILGKKIGNHSGSVHYQAPEESLTWTRPPFRGHLLVLYVSGKVKIIIYCPCPQSTFPLSLCFWSLEATDAIIRWYQDSIKLKVFMKYLPNATVVFLRYSTRNYPSPPETWIWDKKGSGNNIWANIIECSSNQAPKGCYWTFYTQGRQWSSGMKKAYLHSKICTWIFIVALFIIDKK